MRISIDYSLRESGLVEVRIGRRSKNMAMKGLMEKRFGIIATVVEPDRFGNDLLWVIGTNEWLQQQHVYK